MANGYFILSVRRSGSAAFGILETGETAQRFKYDDASLTKAQRRDAVLELVKSVKDRWGNYHDFTDASFRIEEVEVTKDALVKTLISGPAYETVQAVPATRIVVRAELVTIASQATPRFKKNPEMLSNYLFVEADRAIPSPAAWRALDLDERVRLVREVAAGYFTPAVQG